MKHLLPVILLSLLIPSTASAGNGLVLISGTRVNLRGAPTTQSEVVGQASLYSVYAAETTPVSGAGLSWYRLSGEADGLGAPSGLQEAWVSTGLARVVPPAFAVRSTSAPAPETRLVSLPENLLVPAGINSGRLRSALEVLVEKYNAAIRTYGALAPVFADALFLPDDNTLQRLRIDTLGDVCNELQPLLPAISKALEQCEWDPKRIGSRLPPRTASLLSVLEDLGLRIVVAEGDPDFNWTPEPLFKLFRPWLSPDLKAWHDFRASLPEWFGEDAGLSYGPDELVQFVLRTEDFIRTHQACLYRRAAEDLDADLCELLMFCDMDNTRTFGEEDGTIQRDWLRTLEKAAAGNPGPRLASVLGTYLEEVKAAGLHKPEGLQDRIMKQIRASWD